MIVVQMNKKLFFVQYRWVDKPPLKVCVSWTFVSRIKVAFGRGRFRFDNLLGSRAAGSKYTDLLYGGDCCVAISDRALRGNLQTEIVQ